MGYIQCHGLQNKDTEHHADIINLVNSNARLIHYTEVFKAIYFFRLLQKFAEIRLLLAEKLRTNVAIQPNIASHKSLAITHNENMICTLKYTGTMLKCIFVDGQTFDVDDTKPLEIADAIIGYIAEIIK